MKFLAIIMLGAACAMLSVVCALAQTPQQPSPAQLLLQKKVALHSELVPVAARLRAEPLFIRWLGAKDPEAREPYRAELREKRDFLEYERLQSELKAVDAALGQQSAAPRGDAVWERVADALLGVLIGAALALLLALLWLW